MNKLVLIGIIIALFVVYSISVYKLGESNARTEYISQVDTLINYVEIKDTVKVPKFYKVVYKDTIRLTDTIYVEEKTNYIAEIDTTYEDKELDLKVKYISDIPLSKKSYFDIDAKVKSLTVFQPKYIEVELGFWSNRFIPVFGVGGVYTQDGKADLGLFLGFGVRLN